MQLSIDVIIPSFRPQERFLGPLLALRKPADTVVHFFLIIDDPKQIGHIYLQSLRSRQDVTVKINSENKGAAETRNIGIESGFGDWILFLDDDILVKENLLEQYADAIKTHPYENGFIGLVKFPPPHTAFTKAIKAGGSMDIFLIALRKKNHAWGATANIMVSRNATGTVRFSPLFPKKGGGEDVDFFLNIRRRNNYKNFRSLPEAAVDHPWWHGEKADFKRPFRYGCGNSLLGHLHPENTYYDFFNTLELLFISILVLPGVILVFPFYTKILLAFIAGILLIELIAGTIQGIKRSRSSHVGIIFFMAALRIVHDMGVLFGKLSKGQIWRFGERFNDDGSIKRINFHRTNTYKIVKWLLYPILLVSLWIIFLR